MDAYQKSCGRVFGLICLGLIVLCLFVIYGCAAVHPATTMPSITPVHDPVATVNQSLASIIKALIPIGILGWVVAGGGLGLFIYGLVSLDRPVEHIGLLVGSAGAGVGGLALVGIVALPFATYVIWGGIVLALVGAGYEIYVRFFKGKTSTVKIVPVTINKVM